ncbi:MAG: hypothetical protein ACHP79_16980 [Terriglobales bacterium]
MHEAASGCRDFWSSEQLPELTIAKESKLKSCRAGSLVERSIPAIFGNFGSFGNQENVEG